MRKILHLFFCITLSFVMVSQAFAASNVRDDVKAKKDIDKEIAQEIKEMEPLNPSKVNDVTGQYTSYDADQWDVWYTDSQEVALSDDYLWARVGTKFTGPKDTSDPLFSDAGLRLDYYNKAYWGGLKPYDAYQIGVNSEMVISFIGIGSLDISGTNGSLSIGLTSATMKQSDTDSYDYAAEINGYGLEIVPTGVAVITNIANKTSAWTKLYSTSTKTYTYATVKTKILF